MSEKLGHADLLASMTMVRAACDSIRTQYEEARGGEFVDLAWTEVRGALAQIVDEARKLAMKAQQARESTLAGAP